MNTILEMLQLNSAGDKATWLLAALTDVQCVCYS